MSPGIEAEQMVSTSRSGTSSTTPLSRRQFLRASSGSLLALGVPPVLGRGTDAHVVGVGHGSNPYTATSRAITASAG